MSVTVGTAAVVGTIGWYDYSAAAMAGFLSEQEFARQKFEHNADRYSSTSGNPVSSGRW